MRPYAGLIVLHPLFLSFRCQSRGRNARDDSCSAAAARPWARRLVLRRGQMERNMIMTTNSSRPARTAFTMVEFLVVLAIMAILVGILIPAVQYARTSSLRLHCMNNLKQIGIAASMYCDSTGVLPAARLCPAPWLNGQDLYCKQLPSEDTYTGPDEIWWGPYDHRPGTTVTHALPGYAPTGLLLPYVGGALSVFQCPLGQDRTQGSPTNGETFQISYAMVPDLAGHKLDKPALQSIFLAWDHEDLPVCRFNVPEGHWVGWPASNANIVSRHMPATRHGGVFNVCFADGRVDTWSP